MSLNGPYINVVIKDLYIKCIITFTVCHRWEIDHLSFIFVICVMIHLHPWYCNNFLTRLEACPIGL